MGSVLEALRSTDFDEWETVARARLVFGFSVIHDEIPRRDIELLVDEAIALAREWWPEVSAGGQPQVWTYMLVRKLAMERHGMVDS